LVWCATAVQVDRWPGHRHSGWLAMLVFQFGNAQVKPLDFLDGEKVNLSQSSMILVCVWSMQRIMAVVVAGAEHSGSIGTHKSICAKR